MTKLDELRAEWDAAAEAEDAWVSTPSVNRALRWREVERGLTDVRTVLDVGAGPGTFSVPLAERGFEVTHFDLSPRMIELAKRRGDHLPTLRFVEGNAVDLSRFANGSFDLVLAMDGAVSASAGFAEPVLAECARVTAGRLIVTCAHRAWAEAWTLRGDLDAEKLRAFTPGELRPVLEGFGLRVERCGGIGSLELLCGKAS